MIVSKQYFTYQSIPPSYNSTVTLLRSFVIESFKNSITRLYTSLYSLQSLKSPTRPPVPKVSFLACIGQAVTYR